MSKKTIIILTVVLALLVGVSLVSAQSKLPGSGWWSGQQIQNVTTTNASASINLTTYDANGNGVQCGSTKVTAPGASANFLTTTDCTAITAPFVGSAVVSADQPIAAIVNVVNSPGRAAGMYRGTDGSDVANTIAFPLVKNNYFGRSTALYIQNASATTNDIDVVVKVGNNEHKYEKNGVPAYAMIVVDAAILNPAMPNNSVGSATVTGTQPLAGTALEFEAGVATANNLHAYTAFVPQDFAKTAYCPLIRNNYANLNTGIQAQNVLTEPQNISITYTYRINGQGAEKTKTITANNVAASAAATFFTPVDIEDKSVGSAVVTGSKGNIAVIVNDETFTLSPNRVTAYTCFPDNASAKTQRINIPLFKEFYLGDTSGIQVQNLGTSAANLKVTYYPFTGEEVVFLINSVPSLGSTTLYSVSNGTLPLETGSDSPASLLNKAGGVVVESTNGQPIVAIVNEEPGFKAGAAKPASNQDAKVYEGFNQ